jgi:hypothetical protein
VNPALDIPVLLIEPGLLYEKVMDQPEVLLAMVIRFAATIEDQT